MFVKTCTHHGPLEQNQVYKHGKYLECKQCVLDRCRSRHLANRDQILEKRRASYPDRQSHALKYEKERYRTKTDFVKASAHRCKLNRKIEVIRHYSNGSMVCARCPESNLAFLCLDHVSDDGAEHRKREDLRHPYMWAKRNGFPPVFQVLCHNCNCVKNSERPEASPRNPARLATKVEVMSAYCSGTPRCAMCPIDDIRVLSMDHVDGWGSGHRKWMKENGVRNLYVHLKKSGYPAGFRVLCQNHNMGEYCMA
ncbi:MAG: hypothetical protein BWY99_00350 [Synergistetes bacterium ADurb.BinA166]|nr:MAG: hypothetical protein BWY99_00350 [Synergistetes bacterium ADurb.BinA166]